MSFLKFYFMILNMKYIPRALTPQLHKAARGFPALIVTGPRRAGKTTLLRHAFPAASHALLEDPDVIARVRSDPRTFLDELRMPAILDEVQNVPEILNYIRTRIDARPARAGQWLLTGSQEAPLMRGVTESLAGRAAVFQLYPLGTGESSKVSLLRGGFPEVLARPSTAGVWYRSYLQTYLERDVRAISDIRDLSTFRRFLSLVAARTGQVLNKTDLAAPMGVSVPTLTQWLSILEVTGQVLLVPPYFENFGKRLIKSPRLFLADSGLACHLLGIESERSLERSPFLGPLFEGFVAVEVLKHLTSRGRRGEVYYFRDQQGLEVDLVIPAGHRRLLLVEAKSSRTVVPRMAEPLLRLGGAIGGYDILKLVVHRPGREKLAVLTRGVKACGVDGLLGELPA